MFLCHKSNNKHLRNKEEGIARKGKKDKEQVSHNRVENLSDQVVHNIDKLLLVIPFLIIFIDKCFTRISKEIQAKSTY
jgi:hypothetical protein